MMADPRGSNHVSLKDSKDPYFYLQHVSGVAKLAIGAGNDDFFSFRITGKSGGQRCQGRNGCLAGAQVHLPWCCSD